MNRNLSLLLILCVLHFAGIVYGAGLSVGASWRGGMRLRMSERGVGSSANANVSVADVEEELNFIKQQALHTLLSPDTVDHIYDDGYVKTDSGVGDYALAGKRYTWNWGYEHSSQYDAEHQTLIFHKIWEEGGSGIDSGGGYSGISGSKSFSVAAPCLEYDIGEYDLGFGFSFGSSMMAEYFDDEVKISRCREYYPKISAARYLVTSEIRYDASGIAVPECYHGSFSGPFDDPPINPSPLLPLFPAEADVGVECIGMSEGGMENIERASAKRGMVDFDCSYSLAMFTWNAGINWRPVKWMKFGVNGQLILGLADVEVKRTAAVEGTVWQKHRQMLLPGIGVVGTVECDVTSSWKLRAICGYQWFSEDIRISMGSADLKFSADAMTASVELKCTW